MNLGVAHPRAAIVAIDFDEVRQVAAPFVDRQHQHLG